MRDRPVPKSELVALGLAIGASMGTQAAQTYRAALAELLSWRETCRPPGGGPCTCAAAGRADLTGYGDDG